MANARTRNHVGTYLGHRAFYDVDMAKRKHAGQTERALPPRCTHCRQSAGVVMIDEMPHCPTHFIDCDCPEVIDDEG